MNDPAHNPLHSRRRFIRKIAEGGFALGAATAASPVALGATANPFAYDLSRFSHTDPKLIAWEEVSRRVCPVKDARRLAIGPGDVVHIAAGNYLIRWSATGTHPDIDFGTQVTALAVADDGTVVVALRNRVTFLDPAGARRDTWEIGSPKSWFSGLAVTEHDVWIADAGERVIWHHDRTGKRLGRIGAKDAERNIPGFVVPSPFLDVRLHPDGLLRVNNPGRHRVEAYTTGGDLELVWGQPSAGIAGFCGCCNPISLASLPDGRTVTCEKGLPRVKIYAADGTFESVVAGTETFQDNQRLCANPSDCTRGGLDVAVDGQARIHILDRVTGEVRVMRPKSRA